MHVYAIVASKESYELSAKSARDHGLVHEQGLACELYGNYLSSIGNPVASHGFKRRIPAIYNGEHWQRQSNYERSSI
jgi:hypothetical protein